jgi:hypothetical protein
VHVHEHKDGTTDVTGHKTIGLARLLLLPMMEGAAEDGGGPEHSLWIELRTREAIVHARKNRLSDDATGQTDELTGEADWLPFVAID